MADAGRIVVGNGQNRAFQIGSGGIGDGEGDRSIAGKMSARCLYILVGNGDSAAGTWQIYIILMAKEGIAIDVILGIDNVLGRF